MPNSDRRDRFALDDLRRDVIDLPAHLADGTPLRSSGADNLGTLRLVEVLYTSIDEVRAVRLR